MYTKSIGCNGCFGIIIIIFLLLSVFTKLMFFVVPLILLLLIINLLPFIKTALTKVFQREKEFKVKYGVVYKQCAYCGTKADKNAKICSMCKKSFE